MDLAHAWAFHAHPRARDVFILPHIEFVELRQKIKYNFSLCTSSAAAAHSWASSCGERLHLTKVGQSAQPQTAGSFLSLLLEIKMATSDVQTLMRV